MFRHVKNLRCYICKGQNYNIADRFTNHMKNEHKMKVTEIDFTKVVAESQKGEKPDREFKIPDPIMATAKHPMGAFFFFCKAR